MQVRSAHLAPPGRLTSPYTTAYCTALSAVNATRPVYRYSCMPFARCVVPYATSKTAKLTMVLYTQRYNSPPPPPRSAGTCPPPVRATSTCSPCVTALPTTSRLRRDLSTAMAPLCAGKGLDLPALGLDPRAPLIPTDPAAAAATAGGAPPSPAAAAAATSGPKVTWGSFASSLRGLHDVLVARHAEAEAAWAAADSRGKGRIDALELRQVGGVRGREPCGLVAEDSRRRAPTTRLVLNCWQGGRGVVCAVSARSGLAGSVSFHP